MLRTLLALVLSSLACGAAYADSVAPAAVPASTPLDSSGPVEVGTTSMPAGNYLITEQTSGKSYTLMVSNKGTMILAPAPKAVGTAGAPAAPGATAAAATPSSVGTSAVKNMVQKGVEKGVTEMFEKNATNELGKFIK